MSDVKYQMSNIITGLDIGSASVKGVTAIPKKDGTLAVLSVFKHPSAGIRRGVLVNVEDFQSNLKDLFNDLQKISRSATQNVYVNVNSDQVKCRFSRGLVAVNRADQEIQQDDIDRAIQSAASVKLSPNHLMLHNITREYFVDDVGDIAYPLGMTGSRLEASSLIIEVFAPHVTTLVKNLEGVGFGISGLIFNPLAAVESVLSKRLRDIGVLLLDIGFGTTTMAIYEENKLLHVKSIPIGSGYVSKDIAIGLKTSIETAEKLKIAYGFALAREIPRREMIKLAEVGIANGNELSRRFLSEIIEIRLAEILDLVNNELKSLGRTVQLPGGAIITGGGVKLAGTTELVREELKMRVAVGYPDLSNLEIQNPTHQEMLDDPEFAVALGLLQLGYAQEKKKPEGVGLVKKFFKNLIP
jgi:cell division protein FtsA